MEKKHPQAVRTRAAARRGGARNTRIDTNTGRHQCLVVVVVVVVLLILPLPTLLSDAGFDGEALFRLIT